MTDSPPHDEPPDPVADTGQFQAFVDGDPEALVSRRVGAPFRVLTLLAGLVVLGALLWLLFLL